MTRDPRSIREGLEEVRGRIVRACQGAGRDPASVRLVAVSKRHPTSAIRAAYEAGQRHFGENYVQELLAKMDSLAGELGDARWHFIGRLQRNKARHLAGRESVVVETVDSIRLARELARRAEGHDRRLPVLVQVDVAGEPQKGGCPEPELPDLIAELESLPSLSLLGLMCIPPYADDPELSRPWFARLASLARARGLAELSMGMSSDLEVAIQEGATIVRVGTAIFGPRPA